MTRYIVRPLAGAPIEFAAADWALASEAAFDALRLHPGATLSRVDERGERVLAERVSGVRPRHLRGKRPSRIAA